MHEEAMQVIDRAIRIHQDNERQASHNGDAEEVKRLNELMRRLGETKFVLFMDGKRRNGTA